MWRVNTAYILYDCVYTSLRSYIEVVWEGLRSGSSDLICVQVLVFQTFYGGTSCLECPSCRLHAMEWDSKKKKRQLRFYLSRNRIVKCWDSQLKLLWASLHPLALYGLFEVIWIWGPCLTPKLASPHSATDGNVGGPVKNIPVDT